MHDPGEGAGFTFCDIAGSAGVVAFCGITPQLKQRGDFIFFIGDIRAASAPALRCGPESSLLLTGT